MNNIQYRKETTFSQCGMQNYCQQLGGGDDDDDPEWIDGSSNSCIQSLLKVPIVLPTKWIWIKKPGRQGQNIPVRPPTPMSPPASMSHRPIALWDYRLQSQPQRSCRLGLKLRKNNDRPLVVPPRSKGRLPRLRSQLISLTMSPS